MVEKVLVWLMEELGGGIVEGSSMGFSKSSGRLPILSPFHDFFL